MKGLLFKLIVILIVILLVLFSLYFLVTKKAEAPSKSNKIQFQGPPPGAVPYVKGPTAPPPSY